MINSFPLKRAQLLTQKYKKNLQMMTIAIAFIYMTLVVYQNVHGIPAQGAAAIVVSANNSNQEQQPHPGSTVVVVEESDQFLDNLIFSTHTENSGKSTGIHEKTATKHQHQLDPRQASVTATPKPPTTELDDIFISVKTTKANHDTRLSLIIKTWFQLAKYQTWFFTDTDDKFYQEKTNGHMINTNCSSGHSRQALACKMSVELDTYLKSGKKWFCHFDDDNYVNVPRLVRLLDEYSPAKDWYLGKPSISSPLEITIDKKQLITETTVQNAISSSSSASDKKNVTFWFGTGGAGVCISRALAHKMRPIAGNGRFASIANKIRFPDDVTMGFIIEHMLKTPLTVIDQFHSHLEPMGFLRPETFQDQVSFSYAKNKSGVWNVVKIDGFDLKTDPKRFFSIHCHLFPYYSFCPR